MVVWAFPCPSLGADLCLPPCRSRLLWVPMDLVLHSLLACPRPKGAIQLCKRAPLCPAISSAKDLGTIEFRFWFRIKEGSVSLQQSRSVCLTSALLLVVRFKTTVWLATLGDNVNNYCKLPSSKLFLIGRRQCGRRLCTETRVDAPKPTFLHT